MAKAIGEAFADCPSRFEGLSQQARALVLLLLLQHIITLRPRQSRVVARAGEGRVTSLMGKPRGALIAHLRVF